VTGKYLPNFAGMPSWEIFSGGLDVEYCQLLDEGHDVEKYKNLVNEACALPPSLERENIAEALASLMSREPIKEGYPFNEPSGLEEILACRKPVGFAIPKPAGMDALKEKITGAWRGRIAGCLLGKPLEGIMTKDLNVLLKATGNYPLRRYILDSELTDDICAQVEFPLRGRCWADTIAYAPPDDDTDYTVMAATQIIEKRGRDFKPYDVLKTWIDSQPKYAYCTAERVAFINFINGYEPPVSAVYKNPYREWIGAQIRADYYGYINPGNPGAAAGMAWRDASVSHIKNGIYGAMFVSAMLAAAAVRADIRDVILSGLAEIPYSSRLYSEVNKIINMYDAGETVDSCVAYIHGRYDEYSSHHWCHAISNTLIVVTALLYGEKDYGKSICLAVGCGFDTDCNGATVGSVVGMMAGASGISKEWTEPFNGKVGTHIFEVGTISTDLLVELTMKHMALTE